MVSLSGPAMLKRKQRFEKCVERFPERADFYLKQIAELEEGLIAIHACIVCGRPLKGEESRRRGVGKDCLKKLEAQENGN
jgi:hypothetical protein